MPMLDPARAGFTKTGSPSRSRAAASRTAGSGQTAPAASRSTTWSPCGSPAAASSFLVNSLSMEAALENTPDPT